jgi:hypothetical protein
MQRVRHFRLLSGFQHRPRSVGADPNALDKSDVAPLRPGRQVFWWQFQNAALRSASRCCTGSRRSMHSITRGDARQPPHSQRLVTPGGTTSPTWVSLAQSNALQIQD